MTTGSAISLYDKAFFASQIQGSSRSAAVVVPHILSLFPQTKSVVDIGCGTGVWLHHFRLNGLKRTLGIDGGDPSKLLQIDFKDFLTADLRERFPTNESFDLAICLEVAEHLPAGDAESFIAELCRLSEVIVFSAAIPGQGGTGHLNERWPSYWSAIFAKHGYECHDVLRPLIWFDDRVEWWYAQNMLVFRKQTSGARQPDTAGVLDVIHPRCFAQFRIFADNMGYGKPAAIPQAVEKAGEAAVSFQKRILSRFRRQDKSLQSIPASSPELNGSEKEKAPFYHPSAPLRSDTRHLFLEFPILHEFLFDVYGNVPGTQLIQVPPQGWWIGDQEYDYILRSCSPQLRTIFFMSLGRLLFNPKTESLARFAEHVGMPISGILHRNPANASDIAALQKVKRWLGFVIVLSEELVEDTQNLLGSGVNVHYLPHHALNDAYFNAARNIRASIGARPEDLIVSLLGEARAGKGYELLLESLKYIPEKDRERLFFLFGGKAKAWSCEKVQQCLDTNNCRGYVDIRQSIDDHEFRVMDNQEFANYISVSDLGLFLYQGEQRRCASGVTPSYVWARKPILATKNSVVGREVLHHQLGCVLEKETPRGLANLFSRFVADRVRWTMTPQYESFRDTISHEAVISHMQNILDSSAR